MYPVQGWSRCEGRPYRKITIFVEGLVNKMSIKPIDFQVILPKTPEISKIHNDQTQKNISAQQSQASAVQNRAENNVKQVHSRDKSQEALIREKQEKDRQGNKDKDKKPKVKKALKDQETAGGSRSGTIDIRL